MPLISKDAAIEAVKIPDDGCSNPLERHGIIFARVEARRAIQNLPSVPAVPLEPLCKLLSDIYGAPCQLGEIEPYGGCEPDDEGNCYGMRTNNVACWKDFIQHNVGASND